MVGRGGVGSVLTASGVLVLLIGLAWPAQALAAGADSQPTTAPLPPRNWLERLPGAKVIPLPEATAHGGSTFEYCGVYSLYVATRLEKDMQGISLAEVSSIVPTNRGRCSIADLVNAAHALGFDRARAVRLGPEDLRHARLPAVGYCRGERPGEGHFVLFARRRGDYIQILDYPRCIAWVRAQSLRSPVSQWAGETVLLKGAEPKPSPLRAFLLGCSGSWLVIGGLLVGRAIWRRDRRSGEMAGSPGPATGESPAAAGTQLR